MNVFVVGATGYIGSVVAEKLQAAGHQVLGLARSDQAAATLEQRGIAVQRGDLADPHSLAQAARTADGVVHAAQLQFDPHRDFAAQMISTGQIMSAAVQALVEALDGTGKPLLITGGTGAYGDTGDQVATEETPIVALPMMASFAENDRIVLTSTGIRGMSIRPGIVYGHAGGPVRTLFAAAQQTGAVMYSGTGENQLSTVHVDDVADLYVLMLENAPSGTLLNGVAEPFVTQKELMQAVSDAFEFGSAVVAMPDDGNGALYGAGNIFARNMRVSGNKAKQLLGWRPRQASVLDDVRHGSYRVLVAHEQSSNASTS